MNEPIYVGLGSNLDNPLNQVNSAVAALRALPSTSLITHSSWYQSKPIGPPQPDFINGVAELRTSLSPETLLNELQTIEQNHQRVRIEHWGPRTLDLDILVWGKHTIDSKRLIVPHAYLKERSFVLLPLYEIAPTLQLPCGTHLALLAQQCDKKGIKKLPEQH